MTAEHRNNLGGHRAADDLLGAWRNNRARSPRTNEARSSRSGSKSTLAKRNSRETVLALTAAGATTPLALAAVLLYRLVSHGHVLLLGWSAVAARSTRRLPFGAVRGSTAGGPATTDAADSAPRTCRRRRIPRWTLRKGCTIGSDDPQRSKSAITLAQTPSGPHRAPTLPRSCDRLRDNGSVGGNYGQGRISQLEQ